jgi:NADH-quinone oxidoreductase subunit G
LSQPGALLFVGERLATVEGGLSAAVALARSTGARLAWVPRRAGDRGAVDTGCLPNLLPGGRPVTDAAARAELAREWRVDELPGSVGRDTDEILAAARTGRIGALIVAGLDPGDVADPEGALQGLSSLDFLVCLEVRATAVTRLASVVFPVAPVVEKAGTFLDWEGRLRPFTTVLETTAIADSRVLDALARQMGVELGCADVVAIRRELVSLPVSRAGRARDPRITPIRVPTPDAGQAVLSTWHQLIDRGSLIDGDPALTGTARPARVRLSKATATGIGVADGDDVSVSTQHGSITLPAQVVDMVDGVVWLPTNSDGSTVNRSLGVTAGALVAIAGGAR